MSESIEFVFSFRSPYVWIAADHVLPLVHPDIEIRWTPFFPLPEFENFGRVPPGKIRHNLEDILRLANTYGLTIGRPPVNEPDWAPAHAAFVAADRAGKGPDFAKAIIDARWARGEVVSNDGVLGRAAESVGLEADAIVAASHDESLHTELVETIRRNYVEREIFGVPMFILPDGSRFWGHDRMEWAIRYGFVRGTA